MVADLRIELSHLDYETSQLTRAMPAWHSPKDSNLDYRVQSPVSYR